jgi:ABC-type molybdenum transport system ATPase subunit/photorepair protein PhrA
MWSFKAPFAWDDIPPLAVLVGPNGSGKTQLLQLIKAALCSGPENEGLRGGPDKLRDTEVQYVRPEVVASSGSVTNICERTNVRRDITAHLRLHAGAATGVELAAIEVVRQNLLARNIDPVTVGDTDLSIRSVEPVLEGSVC